MNKKTLRRRHKNGPSARVLFTVAALALMTVVSSTSVWWLSSSTENRSRAANDLGGGGGSFATPKPTSKPKNTPTPKPTSGTTQPEPSGGQGSGGDTGNEPQTPPPFCKPNPCLSGFACNEAARRCDLKDVAKANLAIKNQEELLALKRQSGQINAETYQRQLAQLQQVMVTQIKPKVEQEVKDLAKTYSDLVEERNNLRTQMALGEDDPNAPTNPTQYYKTQTQAINSKIQTIEKQLGSCSETDLVCQMARVTLRDQTVATGGSGGGGVTGGSVRSNGESCYLNSTCQSGYCEVGTWVCKTKPSNYCNTNADCGGTTPICNQNRCVTVNIDPLAQSDIVRIGEGFTCYGQYNCICTTGPDTGKTIPPGFVCRTSSSVSYPYSPDVATPEILQGFEQWLIRTGALIDRGHTLNPLEWAAVWTYQISDLLSLGQISVTDNSVEFAKNQCSAGDPNCVLHWLGALINAYSAVAPASSLLPDTLASQATPLANFLKMGLSSITSSFGIPNIFGVQTSDDLARFFSHLFSKPSFENIIPTLDDLNAFAWTRGYASYDDMLKKGKNVVFGESTGWRMQLVGDSSRFQGDNLAFSFYSLDDIATTGGSEVIVSNSIGSGYMGEVFSATIDGKPKVIKLGSDNFSINSAVNQFHLLKDLENHGFTVFPKADDLVTRNGQTAGYSMEFIEGLRLDEYVKYMQNQGIDPYPIPGAEQALRETQMLNEIGIFNVDLKPTNIMMEKVGDNSYRMRIIDPIMVKDRNISDVEILLEIIQGNLVNDL